MKQIIKDISKLTNPASPLRFLTEAGVEKDEGLAIVSNIKEALAADDTMVALSAPQLGLDARVFCIRFKDVIKTFINPVVTKKADYKIRAESFISMPGKEILIMRPEDITVVYYTDEFKYEENRLLGAAARIFDQHCQLLDGLPPSELGLVSDIEEDGPLSDCTEEEFAQLVEIYKKFIAAKTETLKSEIASNPELEKEYNSLKFTEKVINGEASLIANAVSQKAQAAATLSLKKTEQANATANRAQLMKMANKSRKHKGKKGRNK